MFEQFFPVSCILLTPHYQVIIALSKELSFSRHNSCTLAPHIKIQRPELAPLSPSWVFPAQSRWRLDLMISQGALNFHESVWICECFWFLLILLELPLLAAPSHRQLQVSPKIKLTRNKNLEWPKNRLSISPLHTKIIDDDSNYAYKKWIVEFNFPNLLKCTRYFLLQQREHLQCQYAL